MKAKCPMFLCVKQLKECAHYASGDCKIVDCEKGMIYVEIPTADLIAELERRRPLICSKCDNRGFMHCDECYWDTQPSGMKDNFKEAK